MVEICYWWEINFRMCYVYWKASFNQKSLWMGFVTKIFSEKSVYAMKNHCLSCNEKLTWAIVDEEVKADNLLGYKRTNPYLFTRKDWNLYTVLHLDKPRKIHII